MFFDMDLLCRQRNGKFSVIWLASTRGIAFLRKPVINKVNITIVCEEILRFVMSDSAMPRRRLSLYLSAKLLYGTVLVYKKQVKYLEEDVIFYANCIKRPILFNDVKKEPVSKKRKPALPKASRTKEIVKTVQEQILSEEIEFNPNLTDSIHITLPDDVCTRLNILEQEAFGDEGNIDQLLQQYEDIGWSSFVAPDPASVLPIADITTIKIEQDPNELVEEIEQSPRKRRRLESQQHIGALVCVREYGELSPTISDRILMPPPVSPTVRRTRPSRIATQLSNEEILENIKQSTSSSSLLQRKRKSLRFDYSVSTPSKWPMREICCSPIKVKPIDTEEQEFCEVSAKDIIADILCSVKHDEQDMLSVIKGIEEKFSLDMDSEFTKRAKLKRKEPDQIVPVEKSVELENETYIQEPRHAVPGISLLQSNDILSIRGNDMAQKEDSKQEISSTSKIQNVTQSEQPLHKRPDIALMESIEFSSLPQLPEFDSEAQRHITMLRKIREIFTETLRKRLELKDICSPLNKLNVARCFNALLRFHSQEFVILKPKKNHPETVYIYPGNLLFP